MRIPVGGGYRATASSSFILRPIRIRGELWGTSSIRVERYVSQRRWYSCDKSKLKHTPCWRKINVN